MTEAGEKTRKKEEKRNKHDNINNEKLIWANVKTVCVNWKRIFCWFFAVAVVVVMVMVMMMAENLINKWKLIIMKILQFGNFCDLIARWNIKLFDVVGEREWGLAVTIQRKCNLIDVLFNKISTGLFYFVLKYIANQLLKWGWVCARVRISQ